MKEFWLQQLGQEWYYLLKDDLHGKEAENLIDFISNLLEDKVKFAPSVSNIFRVFKLIKPSDVKAICVGQDPYHSIKNGVIIADGLAFSTSIGRIPPSLSNIFKEVKKDGFPNYPKTGNLTSWVEEGVLLINRVMTVEISKPNSHSKKGWEWFTNLVIYKLSEKYTNLVFLLWGEKALKIKPSITNKDQHKLLTTGHPSPYSYNNGFKGCHHFLETNKYLTSVNKTPINWGN